MGKHIFLIGFMGCGKSYWGHLLAERLNRPFVDLDALIETREGKLIADIFGSEGEDAFRIIERNTLHVLEQMTASIVAVGGGTPCFFDNLVWMKTHGKVFYLKTPVAELCRRLKDQRAHRPLLAQMQDDDLQLFIETLLYKRAPFYELADVILENTERQDDLFMAKMERAVAGA